MSIWQDLIGAAPIIGPLINAGANVVGSLVAGNAAGHASDQQANAAQQGLDFQKQVYGQRRSDLQPAIGYGGAAANRLGYLLGLEPLPAPTSMPGAPQAAGPQAPAGPSGPGTGHGINSLIARDTGRQVMVVAPTGETRAMSYADAQAYQQHYPNVTIQGAA